MKVPEDELGDGTELETTSPDEQPGAFNGDTGDGPINEPHRPHIINDGVGEAEASDHIDLDSTDDDTSDRDDEPSV
jgi:hypothetical protein